MPDQSRGPVATEIVARLTTAFAPVHLVVTDDSAKHHGHAGHDPRGESHFSVELVSAAFAGLGRVERQRMVNRALADLLADRVHALTMAVRTPAEAGL
ncbi:BolA family protein [Sphingomonas flavalba]|uniref:BolA family protein n=1 Tax=Sphingomonas flavalba TaxID=2559804 RepID=UPI0039E00F81